MQSWEIERAVLTGFVLRVNFPVVMIIPRSAIYNSVSGQWHGGSAKLRGVDFRARQPRAERVEAGQAIAGL